MKMFLRILLINYEKTTNELHLKGTSAAVVLSTVWKVGARSSFTTGVITNISATTRTLDCSGSIVTARQQARPNIWYATLRGQTRNSRWV